MTGPNKMVTMGQVGVSEFPGGSPLVTKHDTHQGVSDPMIVKVFYNY